MIRGDELIEVGKVMKTHGINGEMSVSFDIDGFDTAVVQGACLVFDIDGIYVPFFVDSSRPRGNGSLLLTLEGEDTQQKAAAFVGMPVYMDTADVGCEEPDPDNEDGVYAADLVGYRAVTSGPEEIGEIAGIDDNTENVLFVVDRGPGRQQALIPVADEMIEDIDHDNKVVTFDLPTGLLEI